MNTIDDIFIITINFISLSYNFCHAYAKINISKISFNLVGIIIIIFPCFPIILLLFLTDSFMKTYF